MSIETEMMPATGLKVTIMAPEVWDALDRLGVGEDILDEVLGVLKEIQPADRVQHLEAWFGDVDC